MRTQVSCLDKEDAVSIAMNVHVEKILILYNSIKLYSSTKHEFLDADIKFSKFCSYKIRMVYINRFIGYAFSMYVQNTILLLHASYTSEDITSL